MATRFYFGSSAAPAISPAFDAAWEQTGQAVRRKLYYKNTLSTLEALTTSATITIPITTTQDILVAQFVGDPLPYPIRIDARNWSMVVGKCSESANTANAHLSFSLRVLNNDGSAVRGTLRSSFVNISEFPLTASAATRIIAAAAITALTTEAGDRICLEVGMHVAAPSAATTGSMRFGFDAASDFALTTALTTDLNGWSEFEQDLFAQDFQNYRAVKVGDGMGTTEKIR